MSLRQLARPTFDKRVDVYQTNRTPGATVAAAVCCCQCLVVLFAGIIAVDVDVVVDAGGVVAGISVVLMLLLYARKLPRSRGLS